MSRSPFDRIAVGGVPFQVASLHEATQWLLDTASRADRRGCAVRLSNAYCVALASFDRRYRALLRAPGVNFPDGSPVVVVMRLLGGARRRASRVRGPSMFRETLQDRRRPGIRHFFLGSTPETLESLCAAARRLNPDILIAGTYSPPFASLDDAYLADLVDHVRGSGADIVWVSLGTPKQDFAAQELAAALDVVAVGVGAGFDFLAGTKPEAPTWVQRSGLEWAFRFASEPGRLWYRYVFGNGWFLILTGVQLVVARSRRHGSPVRSSG